MIKEIEQYIQSLEMSGKSVNTIRTYSKDIRKFIEFFKIEDVSKIQELTQSDYRDFISQLGVSPNSVNGCIRNLNAFHVWLQDNGHVEDSNFFKTKFGKSRYVKVVRKQYDVLTEEESSLLVRSAPNLQTKFMLALMVTVGLRRSEVTGIKLSDIDECKILILGKGNKFRSVYLNDQLCTLLNAYLATRKTNCEYLFHWGDNPISGISVNNRVIEAMRLAGLDEKKKIRAHSLRRTAASNLIVEYDIYTAQKVLGHSNINTTKLYDYSGDRLVEKALLNSKSHLDLD